jgi:RNA-binding protein
MQKDQEDRKFEKLKGFQKKYLRGLAHGLNPVVHIGKKGLSDTLLESLEEALESHELIKIKFIDFKEKDQKREIISELEERTGGELVGLIGHTAIFFRKNSDPEKKGIAVPER